MFQRINLRGLRWARAFVVGDIHGCFDELEAALVNVNFNKQQDFLFSVGDLVDRGPKSELALEYLTQPWFHAVRGNHEQMVIDAGGTSWHVQNGGKWFNRLHLTDQRDFVNRFKQLPLIIEVETDTKRIGVCHASFPPRGNNRKEFICDWNDAKYWSEKTDWVFDDNEILWDRYQIGRAKKVAATGEKGQAFANEFTVRNIDHVYFGHTPLKEPLTVGNCTWLDTGCFATGKLTLIQV